MSKDEDIKENMELAEAVEREYKEGVSFSGEKHSPLLLKSGCSEFKKKGRNIRLNRK